MYFITTVNYTDTVDKMADELKEFYKGRETPKKGYQYDYDDAGNLIVRYKDEVIKTITLPVYRRPTQEEFDSMEQKHREAIALANRAVDDARTLLYEESKKPREERDDATMVRLNRAVIEADSRLHIARYPLTYINRVGGIKIKELDFEQPNETRVLPYSVAFFESRPFTLQEQYARIGVAAEKPLVSVAEAKNAIKMAENVPVILFEGPDSNDYGYLSLQWAVVLQFHSTTYHSAYHAIYTELAKYFDDQIHLPQLLAAKTADEINYSVEDVPGDLETNKEKWNEKLRSLLYDVNLVKFNQYPELSAKLLETGTAMIGAYQPDDNLIGIGISIENPDAKDVNKWSENALGKALMNIRDILRTSSAVAPIAAPVVAPVAASAASSVVKKRTKPKLGVASSTSMKPASESAIDAAPAIESATVPAIESATAPVAVPTPAPVAVPTQVPVAALTQVPVVAPAPLAAPAPVAAPAIESVATSAPVTASVRKPRVAGKPSVAKIILDTTKPM